MLGYCLLVCVSLGALCTLQEAAGEIPDRDESSPHATREGSSAEADGERLPAPPPPPSQPTPPNPPQQTFPSSPSAAAGPVQRASDVGGGVVETGATDDAADGHCPADVEVCMMHTQTHKHNHSCLTPQECTNSQCQWSSELGAIYSLQDFADRVFQTSVFNLKGSQLQFTLCSPTLNCNGRTSHTCLNVPGVKLTSTGMTPSLQPLEPHVPGKGFELVLTDGDLCELTGKPRLTAVRLPCKSNANYAAHQFKPSRASEGTKENVCRYTVEFPASQFGCPVDSMEEGERPLLTAG